MHTSLTPASTSNYGAPDGRAHYLSIGRQGAHASAETISLLQNPLLHYSVKNVQYINENIVGRIFK